MQTNILNYFGQTNGAYIHARGKLATTALASFIDCKDKEKILEIGIGSGATILSLSQQFKKSEFYGVERNRAMYKSALNRHYFCFAKNKITLLNNELALPYSDHFFDKIYLESVLGIQEGVKLKLLLIEIKRVLKNNGILIFNETIWKDHVDKSIASKINSYCMKNYGIIQANESYLHTKDWRSILESLNFQIDKEITVDSAIDNTTFKSFYSIPLFLSKLYDKIGKLRIIFSPQLSKQRQFYKREMIKFNSKLFNYMEGIIFVSTIKKE